MLPRAGSSTLKCDGGLGLAKGLLSAPIASKGQRGGQGGPPALAETSLFYALQDKWFVSRNESKNDILNPQKHVYSNNHSSSKHFPDSHPNEEDGLTSSLILSRTFVKSEGSG